MTHPNEKSVAPITAELEKMPRPVTGSMIAQVGTISANHDDSIGRIIAEAMEKVGKDGVITVEEGKTLETSLEVAKVVRSALQNAASGASLLLTTEAVISEIPEGNRHASSEGRM